MPNRKVIITCAITGSIHTPSMSPHLPITPDQIAADAIAAAEAGAAMLHLHARDPKTGKPDQSPELFEQFMPRIKQSTDAILNVTTGGGLGMSLEQRLAPAKWAQPEVVSMNMGSINFNISGAGGKIADWRHDWEKPYLEMTKDFILSNTFSQIERAMMEMRDTGARFEFECYDVGHLYNLAHFADRKLVEPPFFVQGVFGILGGIGADPENVVHMKSTADRLFGKDYLFSALAAGRHQLPLVTLSALLGGSVRVGLEDSLYIGRGQLARSNAEQVTKIRTIVEALGLEIATPQEARAMLATKGGDQVAF
ncbi:3-keto-5-aminohexanoate cleavage protein [Sphingobium sp. JS3065]|uniref:3-keto-5-aminohexanoate cleavage protein n=1 Tax=Sphingobium sp. JS3065 TaxID=2970925 RepID=UPI002264E451|nr:3-keto-5-aminohexanoate cleavage protein [Sphingobium sp. JS3065]UZW57085.1 3-keto-5-aminohexanoate cleavage protein [Sphingobium sp. JS3065]